MIFRTNRFFLLKIVADLNGLWDYAIKPKGEYFPETYDGKILVPFAIESSLSGVQNTVGLGSY